MSLGLPRIGAAAVLGVGIVVGGCQDFSTIVGVATGSASGAATGNPAVGFAVGVGVAAGANFLVDYIARVRAGAEQDVIAQTAGALPIDGEADWAIYRTIPIGNEHGALRVIEVMTTPIAVCKQIIISVIDGDGPSAPRRSYTASVCRDPQGWQWATAEPAVARWGPL